jgi:beta-carotene hydroxylase
MRLQFTAEQKIAIRQLCRSDSQPLPTLFLFLFGYTLFALALFYGWQERYGIAFPIAMLGQYLLYTTMHEAVHLAASPNRAVNWLIGVASATVFFSPFMAFRYVHLKHHRHTNDPIADPDHWSAGSCIVV